MPTENGKKVLYYCYQIIKNETYLQETVSAINGLLEGTISMGAYNSLMVGFLPHAVRNFSNVYPNIELHLREVACGEFHELLPRGELDLGFMVDSIPKGFSFIPLLRDSACVIMRRDHPFAPYEAISPTLLNGCNFIMPVPGYDDVVNTVLQKSPFFPKIKYYTASDVAAISMVANDLGISVISSLQVGLLPRLFQDLLEHEVGMAALFRGGNVPVHLAVFFLDRRHLIIKDINGLRRHNRNLPVVHIDDVPRPSVPG